MPVQKYSPQGIASLNCANPAVFTVQADKLLEPVTLQEMYSSYRVILSSCTVYTVTRALLKCKTLSRVYSWTLPCLLLVEPWHLVNCTTTCGCLNIGKVTHSF